MKKTLLLASMFLGLASAANAKSEFFFGASVNASKDKYKIDQEHGKTARIGINSEAVKNVQASQKANQEKIEQLNFASGNGAQLAPYYASLTSLQYANTIDAAEYEAIISNPNLTFEQQQAAINQLIIHQGMALVMLSGNEANPVGAELQEMLMVESDERPKPFYQEFSFAISNAETIEEIEAAFNSYQTAAADILNFVAENIPPVYFENELASIYGLAGFEMLSLEDYNNLESLLAEYQDNTEELQSQLEALIAHKQNVIQELDSIKTSSSERNTTVSLFAGFRMDLAKHFMIGVEMGTDLGNIKIGDNSHNELEIRGGTGFYALTRMGVNLSNLTFYGQAGLMTRKYDISYNGTFVKENNAGQNITSAIFGLGVEARITDSIAVFTEYNHISSIDKLETNLIKASLKSDQIKVGSRYYFGF